MLLLAFLGVGYAAPALPPLTTNGENIADYPTMPKELANAIQPSSPLNAITFSPDGNTLASGSYNNTVKLWDTHSKKIIHSFDGHKNTVRSVVFSPDGNTLASASSDNTIKLWDTHSKKIIHTFDGHKFDVNSVAFSPDGNTLASASDDNTVKLWDTHSKKIIHSFDGHKDDVNSIAFSPDGNTLASASSDNTVKLWDAHSKKIIHSFDGHKDDVNSVSFSPDGNTLASASGSVLSPYNTVKLWDTHRKKIIHSFDGHEEQVNSVTFSPDGNTLASASGSLLSPYNNTVKLWDTHRKKIIHSFDGHEDQVNSVAFSPDGNTLALASASSSLSSSPNNTVKLWDMHSKKIIHSFDGHKNWVRAVAFSPDGNTLASTSADNTVKLWDRNSKKIIHSFDEHKDDVNSVAFSPDGNTLASASDDNAVKLWDTHSKKIIHSFDGHKSWISAIAFSPDGNTLASASSDNTVKLWDTHSKKIIHSFDGHKSTVWSVAFSPDGNRLASASYDNTVKLWDTHSKKIIHSFDGHKSSVLSVAFSPDGNTLASASYDNTVKLWDTHSKKIIHSFDGHKRSVNSVAFSPDGNTLASASYDNTLKLWDIQNKTLKHNLISGKQGTWLWQDHQTGKFWRGDNGTLLLHPNKGYIPLPPPQMAKSDHLRVNPVQKSLTLYSGQLSELEVILENKGNSPIWWINTLQTSNKRFEVYPTNHQRLDPQQRTTLRIPIGAYVDTMPKPFTDTLRFELVTAAGSRFPIAIPVTVHAPELTLQNAELLEDQRTLKLTLANNGEQGIPEASFRLLGLKEQLTITDIAPKAVREISFSLPEGKIMDKDSTITLNGWTPSLPLFKWSFADKPVILPRPAWQLYAALLLLLVLVTVAIVYLRRYRHPLLVQLSAQPHTLLHLLPEQLPEAQQRLQQSQRLQKVLADATVSQQTLQGAIAFMHGHQQQKSTNDTLQSTQRAEWLAQRLGCTLTVNKHDKHLFSLKLNHHFPLNVEQCLLFFPPNNMAAVDALNHLHTLPDTAHQMTLIIGHDSDYQRELWRKTLDVANKWIAPKGTTLTALLLSAEPNNVLAQIIAEQVPLTQISPYQLGGGTSRESMFFGRGQLLAHIMNRDPANYLLVAGRQLGKSTLLKALHRRYQDHRQIRCFYRALANEKLAPQLARTLRLPSKTSLEQIVEHLEQQAEQEQRHYLFLIDEADTFIRHERKHHYPTLNALRQLSEAGHCSFILAGFWHLYDYSVLDYQSPLKNFGEVLQLGALEAEACQQLATEPMHNMGIRYASSAVVDELIQQTGQRANLVSISCHELLSQLGKEQRVIEAGDLHRALNSDAISRAMEGWKNLSGIAKDDRIDRIIVYTMIAAEQFTLTELDTQLAQRGFDIPVTALERSLARLELAFILQRNSQYYHWRVPLFCQRLREQDVEVHLKSELRQGRQ